MADTIKIGNIELEKIYLGTSDNVKVYIGTVKLYPKDEPTPSYPYVFERISRGGSAYTIQCDSTSAQTVTSAQTRSGLTIAQLSSTTATQTPVSVTFGDCCKTINRGACSGWTQLTSVTISNSVSDIQSYAFYGCSKLTSVNIPSGVTSINDNTFNQCSLTSINIPDSVTYIGSNAFYYCKLTSVTISSGVTFIGNNGFGYCSELTSITVEATTPPSLGSNNVFNGSTCPIYVPSESVEAYKKASNWSTYASRIQPIS